MMPNIKEIFFEADTRKHQQSVAGILIAFSQKLLDRAMTHDASKLMEPERNNYIGPVWELNTQDIPYGSERYHELTAQMGDGWKHHKASNDHHIEFFEPYSVQTLNDPIRALDLFALIEMLADWIAASQRKGNKPWEALKHLKDEHPLDEQLDAIIRNTLGIMERMEVGRTRPEVIGQGA